LDRIWGSGQDVAVRCRCVPRAASPSLSIDLPLKALVAEDAEGKVSVTYNERT